MRILVICGSHRKESLTKVLTDIAYEYAKSRYANIEYLDLRRTRINNFEGTDSRSLPMLVNS